MAEPVNELATALAKAQGAFSNPARNRTVKVTMKSGGSYTFAYATLDCIMDMVRRPLADNGLALIHKITWTDHNPGCVTQLLHASGQTIECEVPIVIEGNPNAQGWGSSLTYARRYGVCVLLGIAADEDDDGNAACGNEARETNRGAGKPPKSKPEIDAPPNAPSRFDKFKNQLDLMGGDLSRLTKTEPWLLAQTKFTADEHRLLIIHLYQLLIAIEGGNKEPGQLERLNDLGKRIINAQAKSPLTEDDLGELLHKLQPFIDATIKESAPVAA